MVVEKFTQWYTLWVLGLEIHSTNGSILVSWSYASLDHWVWIAKTVVIPHSCALSHVKNCKFVFFLWMSFRGQKICTCSVVPTRRHYCDSCRGLVILVRVIGWKQRQTRDTTWTAGIRINVHKIRNDQVAFCTFWSFLFKWQTWSSLCSTNKKRKVFGIFEQRGHELWKIPL